VKVEVDAFGRRVTVECGDGNVTPKEVLAEVLAAWQVTEGAKKPSDGPGTYGFSTERAAGTERFDWRVGKGQPTPVQACRDYAAVALATGQGEVLPDRDTRGSAFDETTSEGSPTDD
jgi:hypothetical protein